MSLVFIRVVVDNNSCMETRHTHMVYRFIITIIFPSMASSSIYLAWFSCPANKLPIHPVLMCLILFPRMATMHMFLLLSIIPRFQFRLPRLLRPVSFLHIPILKPVFKLNMWPLVLLLASRVTILRNMLDHNQLVKVIIPTLLTSTYRTIMLHHQLHIFPNTLNTVDHSRLQFCHNLCQLQ